MTGPRESNETYRQKRAVKFDYLNFGLCRDSRRRFDSTREKDIEAAKRLCRRCSVQDECLRAALRDQALKGTWGALTAEERGQYRKVMSAG